MGAREQVEVVETSVSRILSQSEIKNRATGHVIFTVVERTVTEL